MTRLPVSIILGACLLLTGISAASVAPYRAIAAIDGLGMSNLTYALVMTLGSIGALVASPLLGFFADRAADRRQLVMLCAALGGLGYGLVYFFPSAPVYIFVFAIVLPFGGAMFSQSLSFSRAYLEGAQPQRAEFMMSVLRSLFSLSWVVAPPVVGWIASSFSVFGVFAAAALAHVGFMLVFGLLFTDPKARVGVPPKGEKQAASAGFAVPLFRLVGIGGVTLIRIALMVHVTALPLVLIKDFGASLPEVGINASVAAALEVPLMLFWGFAATRLSKEVILIGNGALYAAYLILIHFAGSVQDVLLLQGLNALATAALLSITISYMQQAIKGRVGLSTSLIDVVAVISGFSSAALFALLAGTETYVAVLVAAGILSLVGAGIIGLSPMLRPKEFTAA